MNKSDFERDINKLIVSKSNRLIQTSKINLSLFEQRIINYMIAKIKPSDENFDYIHINYNEFCRICGVEYNTNFTYVKQIVKKLYDKSWELFDGNNYVPIKWLDDYKVNQNDIYLKFHFRMKEFLLGLRNNFTETELFYYFQFSNKYSPIFYDYFFSYRNLVLKIDSEEFERIWSIDELRNKIGLNIPNNKGKFKYPLFKDIRVNILEPCINEINEITNLQIKYEIIKKGKKVEAIKFIIKLKDISERVFL